MKITRGQALRYLEDLALRQSRERGEAFRTCEEVRTDETTHALVWCINAGPAPERQALGTVAALVVRLGAEELEVADAPASADPEGGD